VRRSPRTPPVVLAALALLTVLWGTSCAAVAPYAARIDGTEISDRDFGDELDAILGNESYLQQLELSGAQVRGEGQGTLRTAYVANLLSIRIILQIIHDEFERRDVRVGAAVRDLAQADVANQVGGREVLAAFDDDYRQYLLRRWEEVLALQLELAGASIAEEDLRANYRQNSGAFTETCVSHILVSVTDAAGQIDFAAVSEQAGALEAEAGALRTAIEDGADFAAVAQESSADTGSGSQGGELGCAPPGQYVPEFEEAVAGLEVGELSVPTRTEFGFHLILVTDRRAAPFDDVVDQLRQRVLQEAQQPLQELIQERMAEAEVEVNPRYGEFQSETGQVVPPEGPTGGGQRSSRAPVPTPLP
jgi:hypothetical protein